MFYTEKKQFIEKAYRDYQKELSQKAIRHVITVHKFDDKSELKISVPGYKHRISGKMDFAVFMTPNELTLGHCDIITDIYWKIKYRKADAVQLQGWIDNLFHDGTISDVVENYTPASMSPEYISEIKAIIECERVKHNKNSNYSTSKYLVAGIELSYDQLGHNIRWIALQEDINYPRSENCQGRKRPLMVYSEAIAAARALEGSPGIQNVITRALSRGRLKPLIGVLYGNIIHAELQP